MTTPPPDPEPEEPRRPDASGKPGRSIFGGILSLEKRLVVAGGAIFGLAAALVAFIGNIDSLQSRYEKWHRDRQYQSTLRRPYPNVLTEPDIERWSSGRLKLALLQIDGYLGRERTAPSWKKSCLTSPNVFKNNLKSEYNDQVEIDENYVDKANRELIQRRIDSYAIDKTEDGDILKIPDPFDRLLKRSAVQLLADYKDTEIAALDKPQHYLLRNAIYGQHGFVFDTPKLRKLANRRGWNAEAATFTMDSLSEVEKCNAFFLEDMHPQKELGALGRGVLIRQTDSPTFVPLLKPMLCTCLGQSKSAIDCHESALDPSDEFRDHVDLVLEIEAGDAVRVDWTFLDPQYVVPPDLPVFQANRYRFIAAAVDLSATLHQTFRARNFSVAVSQDMRRSSYWGAKVTLSPEAIRQLSSDPSFLKDTATNMCTAIRESLEMTGPYIPRTVDLVSAKPDPAQPSLAIFDRPIVFDDLRTRLTKEYITRNYGVRGPGTELNPSMIVVDWTDTADLDAAYEKFKPSVLPGSRKSFSAREGMVNFAVHYLIDRDGTVYSLMKDVEIARSLVGLDRHAVAVAVVGSGAAPPTASQAQAAGQLVRFLTKKFKAIKFMIGASEYQPFVGTALWEEKDPQVRPVAAGPGREFLDDLRSRLGDVALQSKP